MTGVEAACIGLGAFVGNLIAAAFRKKKPAEPPREKQCASARTERIQSPAGYKIENERCVAIADPRCLGGNCTLHCRHGGCAGKCLE